MCKQFLGLSALAVLCFAVGQSVALVPEHDVPHIDPTSISAPFGSIDPVDLLYFNARVLSNACGSVVQTDQAPWPCPPN